MGMSPGNGKTCNQITRSLHHYILVHSLSYTRKLLKEHHYPVIVSSHYLIKSLLYLSNFPNFYKWWMCDTRVAHPSCIIGTEGF